MPDWLEQSAVLRAKGNLREERENLRKETIGMKAGKRKQKETAEKVVPEVAEKNIAPETGVTGSKLHWEQAREKETWLKIHREQEPEAWPEITAIVAVDEAWGIGRNNEMLFSIPEDMKFFREKTLGGVLIMGRKTLESFPGGKPLPKRENIVLSRSLSPREGITVCETMEEIFRLIKKENQRPIFCIGGAMVYEEFLPYCKKAYVTKMYRDFHGETFFPNLDGMEEWSVVWESERKVWKDVEFQFFCYENQNVKSR